MVAVETGEEAPLPLSPDIVPGIKMDEEVNSEDPNYSLASLGAGLHVPVLGQNER